MHVEAAGCRDRHQGIAARDAHRDRLENLAGIDAERPGLSDRGVALLVRDGLERDAAGCEMLRYLRHHLTPDLARGTEHSADTPLAAHGSYRPAGGGRGRAGAAAPGRCPPARSAAVPGATGPRRSPLAGQSVPAPPVDV